MSVCVGVRECAQACICGRSLSYSRSPERGAAALLHERYGEGGREGEWEKTIDGNNEREREKETDKNRGRERDGVTAEAAEVGGSPGAQ